MPLSLGLGIGLASQRDFGWIISDDFARSDTVAPDLGTPSGIRTNIHTPWTLFTNNMALPAVGGHISSQKYVADDGQVVYAVQDIKRPVRSIRGLFSFSDAAQGTQTTFASAVCIISKDSAIIDNAVHLVPTRTGVNVQKIISQSFTTGLGGGWSYATATRIPKDGATLVPFRFDLAEDGSYTVLYAGRLSTGSDADLPGLAGASSWVCAEVFNSPITNLDSSAQFKGIAFGPAGSLTTVLPLIAQNNFDASTGLTLGTGWSISAGVAVHSGGAGNLTPTSGPAAEVGKRYLITYTLTASGFTGNMTFSFGGASGTTRTAQGTYSDIVTAVNTNSWVIAGGSGASNQFVNEFSIVELDTF